MMTTKRTWRQYFFHLFHQIVDWFIYHFQKIYQGVGLFILLLLLQNTVFAQHNSTKLYLDTTTVTSNLRIPWSMDWLGKEEIIFSEIGGRIGKVNVQTGVQTTLFQFKNIARELQGGLLGLVVHPDFSTTQKLYAAHTFYKKKDIYLRVVEMNLEGNDLKINKILIDEIPVIAINIGGRLAIDGDYLFLTVGEGEYSESAQETDNLFGKILRYHLDGTIPSDNPYPNNPIWATGIRNSQGLTVGKSNLYCSEHGTLGDDELNLVTAKGNYGWPITGGKCYDGREICSEKGLIDPLQEWSPSIAPCGIAFHHGKNFPSLQNNVLMACLKTQSLKAVQLSDDGQRFIGERDFLKKVVGRIRDVLVTPQGRIFICTSNEDVYGKPRPGGDRIFELTPSEQELIAQIKQKEPDQLVHLDSTTLSLRVIKEKLVLPWDMVWGYDNWIWFSERGGSIKRINPETGVVKLVHFVEGVYEGEDNSGMHGFALHPDFPKTPWMYVHYTTGPMKAVLMRYTYSEEKQAVIEEKTLINDLAGHKSHNGSRLVFAEDGTLFFSMGDAYKKKYPQNLESNNGKILRLNDDGTYPKDNPYPQSYVWSYGHRNPQGLVFANGQLYSTEHGPANDDELNKIEKGGNYGWPKIQGFCDQRSEKKYCQKNKVIEPLHAWTPTIGVCGMDYYNHDAIPEWKNSLLVVALQSGAGEYGQRMYQFPIDQNSGDATLKEDFLSYSFGRLRDVLVAPDGRVFICTSNVESNDNGWEVLKSVDDRIIEIKAVGKKEMSSPNLQLGSQ